MFRSDSNGRLNTIYILGKRGVGKTSLLNILLGRGYDEKGDYISYYDKFDLNPFTDKYYGTPIPFLKNMEDATFGIGKPVHLYDRLYLDDYYGVPHTGSFYLPEVEVNGYKHGKDSGIYIKPSKRGTFTAAAKKRGLSVQSFASKVLNNPSNYSKAMRKKAQFAKNASKFKH